MKPEILQKQIHTLLMSIYRRTGITRAKEILSTLDIDTSLGWDSLLDELLSDSTKHEQLHRKLKVVFKELLMYGARFFECYDVEKDKLSGFFELLDRENPTEFDIDQLVDVDRLNQKENFKLFAKQDSPNAITYYFLHMAECTERVVLEQDAIKEQYCFEEGFDRIIATSKARRMFVNAIRYEKSQGKCYVMIDRANEIGLRNLREVRDDFTHLVDSNYEEAKGELFFSKKVNMFDKVVALYDGTLGIVRELKFLCPSGTVRHELLSIGNKFSDLRDELYHKAGMQEISYAFDPFYISIVFETGELSLLGQKSMTKIESPKPLTEGIIRKSYTCEQYSYLLKVLNDA